MQSAVTIVNTTSASTQQLTPLKRLIVDGISIIVNYGINFVFCDLMYHNFNIQQTIKGSYWFVLGPVLYIFGPTLKWVQLWIRALIGKEKVKIKEKLEEWWGNFDPFNILSTIMDESLFSQDAIKIQKENLEYLHEIKRIL